MVTKWYIEFFALKLDHYKNLIGPKRVHPKCIEGLHPKLFTAQGKSLLTVTWMRTSGRRATTMMKRLAK